MPLSIHFDHRLDRLADALAERVSRPTQGPALCAHPVVVPSIGVGRWLQQRLASRAGVCARVEPEFPGALLWRWLRELMPELPARSPFDPAIVRWRLLAMFDALPADVAELAPLRERLARAAGAQRLSVATEMAMLFDRYLAWRRDWLERWQRGEPGEYGAGGAASALLGPHEPWQRWLWRALLEATPDLADRHPHERLETLIRGDPAAARAVFAGRRLSVFGVPGMSPAQFELFGFLGEVADVAFFSPDPCREWWEDLVDGRSRARVLAARPDDAWLYDGEPSVLGDWGRAQRDFVAQVAGLQERFGVQAHEPFRALDDPDEAEHADGVDADPDPDPDSRMLPSSCLRALRRAVFLRSDAPWQEVAGADDSIVFHAAHGAIRQAEVLHDALLDCFERFPGLRPSDIAVFCADVETAAAAIEAVFASAGDGRRIPVTVSGRPPKADPLLRAVLALPGLAGQGPDLPSIEDWLLNPAVVESSGLAADDVPGLIEMLGSAGARWGLDAADGADKHGWQDAFDRLLIGAAVDHGVTLVGDMAPVSGLRGSRAAQLEPVLRLFAVLRALRAFSSRRHPVSEWCREMHRAVERLFGATRRHAAALARFRDALAELAQAAEAAPAVAIDSAAFELVLEDALRGSAPAASTSGAVTVCPIGALRGVPFRVVCLFGMDEGVFPRRGSRSEADLMLRAPRFGDRHPRSDERGVFLDAVLAARERLIVSFRGRDARDDAVLNPSPVVLELLDYLRARLDVGAGLALRRRAPERADASAIFEHSLHPFAPRAFAGDGSHAIEWQAAARALAAPLASRSRPAGPLVTDHGPGAPEAGLEAFSLELLRAALADPVSFWLRRRLGIALPRGEGRIDAVEPLWPDESGDRDLLEWAARSLLAGESADSVEAVLRAVPRTGGGSIGARQARGLIGHAGGLVERVGGVQTGARMLELAFTHDDGKVLRARLPSPGPDGRQRIVSGFALNLHGLVEAWLRHALLATAQPVAETVLAAPDALATIRIADPQAALRHAFDAVDRILAGPPVAFPRAWLAGWRESKQRGPIAGLLLAGDGRAPQIRRKLAATLEGGPWSPGELDKPWQAAFWRDAAPELERLASDGDALWAPILADVEIEAEP